MFLERAINISFKQISAPIEQNFDMSDRSDRKFDSIENQTKKNRKECINSWRMTDNDRTVKHRVIENL